VFVLILHLTHTHFFTFAEAEAAHGMPNPVEIAAVNAAVKGTRIKNATDTAKEPTGIDAEKAVVIEIGSGIANVNATGLVAVDRGMSVAEEPMIVAFAMVAAIVKGTDARGIDVAAAALSPCCRIDPGINAVAVAPANSSANG